MTLLITHVVDKHNQSKEHINYSLIIKCHKQFSISESKLYKAN